MSQDDVELKDLIIEKLSNSGILNDLKAQIRAAVLHTLSQGKEIKIPTIEQRKIIDSAVQSTEGKLAFSLLRDFMEKLNLKNTLSVFCLESGLNDSDLMSRNSIVDEYKHLVTANKADEPIIYSFIKNTVESPIEFNDKEIIRGLSKSKNASPKSKRILPLVSDQIEFKSEDTSEFSDVIGLLDVSTKKNTSTDSYSSSRIPKFIANKNDKEKADIDKPVISPYQAPQKRNSAGSGTGDHYDDSFSEKSSITKHNQSDADESIDEVDVEEIDYKSEDRSGDITVDSERSLSLDYFEEAKPKKSPQKI